MGKTSYDKAGSAAAVSLPDLEVKETFRVAVNHGARTMCVSGFIRNIGNAPVRNPFRIAIGISYSRAGIRYSSESVFTIEAPIAVDEEIETPCASASLVYLNEDAGGRYTLELLADYDFSVTEFLSSNNYYRAEWFILSPSALASGPSLVIQTSP